MSFSEQYAALECKFKEQVKKDNEDFGIESYFLANVAPKAPVDYVLVAMEPSRPANIASIKNFAVSVEDFILHFCAKEYLCKGECERTYHITDLSKGAMCGYRTLQAVLHSGTRGTRGGIRCSVKRSNLWRGLTHR